MSRETDIKLLMDDWKEKHKNNGYKRIIRDGIVCEENGKHSIHQEYVIS